MRLPEYIQVMLRDIARDEGFCKHKFVAESGSNHGDNIHGVMVAVKVIGERVNGDKNSNTESLHLMCKTAPTSKECRDSLQSALLFKREIYLYTRVFPAFVEFQRAKGLNRADGFLAFPKVYATLADDENENYALIMEDMRPRKFVMWPRHDPLPLSHEKIVLETLAKLHGVSLAMKHQYPNEFDDFKELGDVAETQIERGNFGYVIASALEQAINVLRNEEHQRIMEKCRVGYRQILSECFGKEANDRFGVINHGDCWINNCLFQYEENTHEVMNVCLVDWQLSRYSSPAPDVLYQIFSSTRKPLRDRNYFELIRCYHMELSDTVTKLGSDPEKLFSFSDFENELKAFGKFILVMGTLVVQYVLAQPNDIRDIDEYCEQLASSNNNTSPSLLKSICEENDQRVAAINELVSDVITYGYDCSS